MGHLFSGFKNDNRRKRQTGLRSTSNHTTFKSLEQQTCHSKRLSNIVALRVIGGLHHGERGQKLPFSFFIFDNFVRLPLRFRTGIPCHAMKAYLTYYAGLVPLRSRLTDLKPCLGISLKASGNL